VPDPDAPQPNAPQPNAIVAQTHKGDSFDVGVRLADGRGAYVEGDMIGFIVEASRDCYITLLAVDPAGEIAVLLPNGIQLDNFVPAGRAVTIPAADAEFRLFARPPHGRTLVKAIATRRPIRFTGMSRRRLIDEQFIVLEPDFGVSIEGESREHARIGDVLKADEWATVEVVFTTKAR
jgi:hypothetical protein